MRFEFFHRLRTSASRRRRGERHTSTALEFDVQANCRGRQRIEPLVDVDGLPLLAVGSPTSDQLVNGSGLRAEDVEFESHWETGKCARTTLA